MKKIFTIFALALLLLSPSISFASSTVTETLEEFETDSYNEDGCFC